MRKYSEFTAKNLLRPPLIMGVPMFPLLGLVGVVMAFMLLGADSSAMNGAGLVVGITGYVVLRLITRFATPGWEQGIVFKIENLIRPKKVKIPESEWAQSRITIESPDTLEEIDLIRHKDAVSDRIAALKASEELILKVTVDETGASLFEQTRSGSDSEPIGHVYSLTGLPTTTDPLWMFSALKGLVGSYQVFVRVRGLSHHTMKRRLEMSRRRHLQVSSRISDIDSEVTFSEASRVLEGISRGDDSVVEFSLVLRSRDPIHDLDPFYWTKEKNTALSMASITGTRKLFHRSHIVRVSTAADLIPTIMDPFETGAPILKSVRGLPLYFSPDDSRLEALHWLVVGASGSGKSFFTGLVLKRMLEQGVQASVLFVDHNRSFRRIVNSLKSMYLEPECAEELDFYTADLLRPLNTPGTIQGVELSDLPVSEKKEAVTLLLQDIEYFLRTRDTVHPIYVVLDECWNFLRDEPVLVQRAFREFRKLNGAVIAITQSLSDFVTDVTGQSILQNAPVRILLRQGEDLTPFRGALSLNDVELSRLKLLRQVKGEYSECLIKTPFLSRLGRLYPTESEYALLRTDNIRAEMIAGLETKTEMTEPSCAIL